MKKNRPGQQRSEAKGEMKKKKQRTGVALTRSSATRDGRVFRGTRRDFGNCSSGGTEVPKAKDRVTARVNTRRMAHGSGSDRHGDSVQRRVDRRVPKPRSTAAAPAFVSSYWICCFFFSLCSSSLSGDDIGVSFWVVRHRQPDQTNRVWISLPCFFFRAFSSAARPVRCLDGDRVSGIVASNYWPRAPAETGEPNRQRADIRHTVLPYLHLIRDVMQVPRSNMELRGVEYLALARWRWSIHRFHQVTAAATSVAGADRSIASWLACVCCVGVLADSSDTCITTTRKESGERTRGGKERASAGGGGNGGNGGNGGGGGGGGNGGGGSDGKPTRVRTVLNEKQLHTLRTCYAANPRPDALMKEQLVEMTGLSPRVIRVWFQNKRCKDKKKAILMKQIQQQEKVRPNTYYQVGLRFYQSHPPVSLVSHCLWPVINPPPDVFHPTLHSSRPLFVNRSRGNKRNRERERERERERGHNTYLIQSSRRLDHPHLIIER